jgi:predicted SprT family Zn-dependent metalloprotease
VTRPEALDVPELHRTVAPWAEAWGVTGLEHRVEICFNPRLKRSLGRCVPTKGEIRLAGFLRRGPPKLLREVLCHEAAHAAVYELHGVGPRPHGREWRALMEAVGFEARARFPAHLVPEAHRTPRRPSTLWEYRCAVCHAARVARRRMPKWRCVRCRASGLDGSLVSTRLDGIDARAFPAPPVT